MLPIGSGRVVGLLWIACDLYSNIILYPVTMCDSWLQLVWGMAHSISRHTLPVTMGELMDPSESSPAGSDVMSYPVTMGVAMDQEVYDALHQMIYHTRYPWLHLKITDHVCNPWTRRHGHKCYLFTYAPLNYIPMDNNRQHYDNIL